jgi:hypothetical protein
VLFAERTVEMADVSRVRVSGRLGPFVAGFVAELSPQGVQPVTVGKQVGLAGGGGCGLRLLSSEN